MTSVFFVASPDGYVTPLDEPAPLGPTADGSTVYEITDCPPGATFQDILPQLDGYAPHPGEYQISLPDLSAVRSSCCGSCG